MESKPIMRLVFSGIFLLGLLIFPTATLAQQEPLRPPDPFEQTPPLFTAQLTTGDGALTVYHPEGWVTLADESQLTFASRDTVLNSPFPFNLREANDFRGGVFVLERDLSGEDEDKALTLLTDTFIQLATDTEMFKFDSPQSAVLTQRKAVIVQGGSTFADQIFVAVSLGDGYYAVVLFFTTPGSGSEFIQTAQTIAENMEYTSPENRMYEA